jgi:hypothetical protein
MSVVLFSLFAVASVHFVLGEYFLGSSAGTWDQANAICESDPGGQLASAHDDADNVLIGAACTTSSCWIGLHRLASDNTRWAWSDGSRIDFGFNNFDDASPTPGAPWHAGEPNNPIEGCAQFYGNSLTWNDMGCTGILVPVCQRPDPTNCDVISVDKYLQHCSSAFPASQARIAAVEESVGAVDGTAGANAAAITALTNQVNNLEQTVVPAADSRIATLESDASTTQEQISSILGKLAELAADAAKAPAVNAVLSSVVEGGHSTPSSSHLLIVVLVCVNVMMFVAVCCLWSKLASATKGTTNRANAIGGAARYATVNMTSGSDSES